LLSVQWLELTDASAGMQFLNSPGGCVELRKRERRTIETAVSASSFSKDSAKLSIPDIQFSLRN
jgi:hypothetical protein